MQQKLYYKDIGCRAGGSLSCLNEGKCMPNGICECKQGYYGSTCSNLRSKNIIPIIISSKN